MYIYQDFPASHAQKPNLLRATGLAPEVSTIQRQMHRGFGIWDPTGMGATRETCLRMVYL